MITPPILKKNLLSASGYELIARWYLIVTYYSHRRLSESQDRSKAVEGIVREMQERIL